MAERQFDSTIFNYSIRIQNGSVMRFYFFLLVILIILHWKIVSTLLNPSFHSTPNSRCFVLVHFQSHNAPNFPPLHISEMGYSRSSKSFLMEAGFLKHFILFPCILQQFFELEKKSSLVTRSVSAKSCTCETDSFHSCTQLTPHA